MAQHTGNLPRSGKRHYLAKQDIAVDAISISSYRWAEPMIEGISTNPVTAPPEALAQRILYIRGHKVMLDAELAELYGVPTKRLNEQVRRNLARFPEDFMFRLTTEETEMVNRSQFATGSQKHRDPRFPPFAFTEHGALMLGNVLRSDRAIEVSLMIVRAFVQLREMLSTHKELAAKLEALERKVGSHDQAIAGLIDAIRQLMAPPAPRKLSIGFITDKESGN